jgi:hypothetical protein
MKPLDLNNIHEEMFAMSYDVLETKWFVKHTLWTMHTPDHIMSQLEEQLMISI